MTDRIHTLRDLLAQHGKLTVAVSGLRIDQSLYGAGLTSHASVNLMLAIEDEFDFEFPEHLLKRSTFETIESLSAAVDGALRADA